MVSLEQAAQLALALPEVTEGERYGHRTWAVAGKAFVWERPFSKVDIKRFGDQTPPDGDILAIRVEDLDEKAAVLAAHAGPVFTIPHFDGYPAVLVHLRSITRRALRVLITDGWLCFAPTALANQYLERS